VIDYKTDARPPSGPGDVEASYLQQLACYRAAAMAIWPERLVEAGILWTATPSVMLLPGDWLDGALANGAISPA